MIGSLLHSLEGKRLNKTDKRLKRDLEWLEKQDAKEKERPTKWMPEKVLIEASYDHICQCFHDFRDAKEHKCPSGTSYGLRVVQKQLDPTTYPILLFDITSVQPPPLHGSKDNCHLMHRFRGSSAIEYRGELGQYCAKNDVLMQCMHALSLSDMDLAAWFWPNSQEKKQKRYRARFDIATHRISGTANVDPTRNHAFSLDCFHYQDVLRWVVRSSPKDKTQDPRAFADALLYRKIDSALLTGPDKDTLAGQVPSNPLTVSLVRALCRSDRRMAECAGSTWAPCYRASLTHLLHALSSSSSQKKQVAQLRAVLVACCCNELWD